MTEENICKDLYGRIAGSFRNGVLEEILKVFEDEDIHLDHLIP